MKKLKILFSLAIAMVLIYISPLWTYMRSSNIYWMLADNIAMPILRQLDPERAHNLSIKATQYNFAPIDKSNPQILHSTVWGLEFSNPIGLAAGYDKQALAMSGLLDMGFGFIEVGGITPEPQPGNPKPRLFRLHEDQAIINRFGLNSEGQAIVAQRLKDFKNQQHLGIVGVNLAKNTSSNELINDYKKGIQNLGAHVDFIVLNVSCPNVAWTKALSTSGDEMHELVCAIKKERDQLNLPKVPPLLIKLGPNMNHDAKAHMASIALECGVDGLVVSNTTSERPESLKSPYSKETGGLSGVPLKEASLQTLKDMYHLTHGKLPIIAVGGIDSAEEVYKRIRAGASLVEVYTALVYQGPGLLRKMKSELQALLEKDGLTSLSAAIGLDANSNQE